MSPRQLRAKLGVAEDMARQLGTTVSELRSIEGAALSARRFGELDGYLRALGCELGVQAQDSHRAEALS